MYITNNYRNAVLGIDLGYAKHPSALCLLTEVEQTRSPYTWIDPTHPKTLQWVVSYAKVIPPGTFFTEIARYSAAIAANFKRQHPKANLYIVPDSTGLGRSIVELLYQAKKAHSTPTGHLEGLIFTGGHQHSVQKHTNYSIDIYNVPKLTLLNSLTLAIESGLLKIPANLPERETLLAQLAALEVHYPSKSNGARGPAATQAGLDTGNNRAPIVRLNPDALRENPTTLAHADLVMSLAIATWRLQHKQRASIKLLS